MDEIERKQLAERLHSYSAMPGLPSEIQTDLVKAAVLIHAGEPAKDDAKSQPQESVEEKNSSKFDEEPISHKYMSDNRFDHIGYAHEVLRKYGLSNLDPSGIDSDIRGR